MAAATLTSELLARLGSVARPAEALGLEAKALALGWPELDDALPDHGLPRGVVELAAPRALGGGTSIALAAVRAAHGKDARAWCAWIDPEGTLHAPGVAGAGVDLARLLVVRPPRAELARVAVKVAASRAFDVIVVDMDPVPGALVPGRTPYAPRTRAKKGGAWQGDVFVRKLALLASEGGASVLLLTDATAPRAQPGPVALRLEIAREPAAIALRVAKDRRGRAGLAKTVPLASRPSGQIAR
jgi:recombination protein RecA